MKKKNRFAFVLILLLGTAGIVSVLVYGAHMAANTPQPFVRERRGSGERMYREIFNTDLEEDFPQNPHRLMELYNRTVMFLYGNFIQCEDLFMRAIEFQRQLFAQDLLAQTSAQAQFDNLMGHLEILAASGVVVLDASVEDIRYDFIDQRVAAVHVRRRFMFHEPLYRIYFLELDDSDRWLIRHWIVTDQHFEPL